VEAFEGRADYRTR